MADQERLQLRLEVLDREVAAKEADIKQVVAELKQEQDAVKAQRLEKQYDDLVADKRRLYDQRQELQRALAGGAGAAGGVDVTKALESFKSSLMEHLDKQAMAAKAAEQAAERTEQQLKNTQTALLDDIRSWNSSHTTEASKVSVSDIQLLRRLLRIRFDPFDDTDPTQVLHPSACDADFEWDNTPEPSQRQQYMAVIEENTQHGLFERLIWKPQTKAEIVVRGLGHRIVARSDELLCARKWQYVPDAGCVIGIELKKDLTQAARRQGEAEFIAFGLTSNFPFLQLVTDMKRGGFAYYKQADDNGHQVVVEQVLLGMGIVYDTLNAALSTLPDSLTTVRGEVHVPHQLPSPLRCKLVDPFILQAAASVHDAGPDCGDDALDELSAWFSKEQLAATGDLPDACSFSDQQTVS